MFNVKQLLTSAFILVLIDFIYLQLIKSYFANQIKIIQGSIMQINLLGAFICYLFLVLGINYFILSSSKSVFDAFLLGLIIYGVFETTNKALFSKWDWKTVFIDTLWGGILFAITTYLFYKIN